jgi:hypothetical protein
VLAAEGETILYVSSHGPFEKGKDVITRTAVGEIRAYQLKAGDISLSGWRDIHGEIVNLVELAIELPGTTPITEFVPYLVTNGELKDPVLEQVRVENVTWQSRGIDKTLKVIQKGELFERFRASHGAYLPRELADFRTFLELILHDGAAPADKEKAAQLIEHVLPREPQQESPLNVARAASSIVLLAAYITGPAVLASNHWCVFEYWVLTGAYPLLGREVQQGGIRLPGFIRALRNCRRSCTQRAHRGVRGAQRFHPGTSLNRRSHIPHAHHGFGRTS